MNNYICINGKKAELTAEQIKLLGLETESEIAKLARLSREGKASEYYKVHDVIESYGKIFEIVGIGHDIDSITGRNNTVTLRSIVSPVKTIFHTKACPLGYKESALRDYFEKGCVTEWLPAEIKDHMRTVKKLTANYKGELDEIVCTAFPFSESELFGSAIYSPVEEGRRYEAFATRKDRFFTDIAGNPMWYWTRSPYTNISNSFCGVSSSGAASNYNAGYAGGVACGFCV